MDQDTRNLILQLCSYAGAMMEAASLPAVTAGEVADSELSSLIEDLVKQAQQISMLLVAAAALTEVQPNISAANSISSSYAGLNDCLRDQILPL